MLLSLCLGFTSMLYEKTKSVKVEQAQLAYAELYAIQQVKKSLKLKEEENDEIENGEDENRNSTIDDEQGEKLQQFQYDEYEIEIMYEMDMYTIQIYGGGYREIHSQIKIDMNSNKILDYIYL